MSLSTSVLEANIKADMPYIDTYAYRQDNDGYWSHKRGTTDLIFWDASQANIINPRTCDRNYSTANYSTWCGFYQYTYTN